MPQSDANSLKPCPFCGKQAFVERAFGNTFSVVCHGCGAVALHPAVQGRSQLTQLWNLRKHRVNFSVQNIAQPCPFCASRQTVMGKGQSGPIVQCQTCGMRVSFATADTPSAALKRWNKRTGE